MKKNSTWMAISGTVAFSCFLFANFTDIFQGSSVLAGMLQLSGNTFVFFSWRRDYLVRRGFRKFFASLGVYGPIIMAGITIWRVLIPFVLQRLI